MIEIVLPLGIVAGFIGLGAGTYVWLESRKKARLEAAADIELTDQRLKKLKKNVPLLERLNSEQYDRLQRMMLMFQADKNWEACGGLTEVTLEMKDSISAQACLLVLENGLPVYPELRSILIYPAAYRARSRHQDDSTRLGESWDSGSVVLSWQGVKSSGRDDSDGFNLVIHEFAHQLDQADGPADGVPQLAEPEDYEGWSRAFSAAYESFCDAINRGQKVEVDEYGATNEAEFFSVTSEFYFERPDVLKESFPEVFQLLKAFYRV